MQLPAEILSWRRLFLDWGLWVQAALFNSPEDQNSQGKNSNKNWL